MKWTTHESLQNINVSIDWASVRLHDLSRRQLSSGKKHAIFNVNEWIIVLLPCWNGISFSNKSIAKKTE